MKLAVRDGPPPPLDTIGRFKKYFFSQIITSIHLFVAPVAKKSLQKILSQNLSGKPLRMATPVFGSLIQVKFCLFWVSKLYGYAQPVFGHTLFFTGEIPKNGFFSPILPFYVLGTLFLQYKW